MAFPSNTGTKKDDLQSAWRDARAVAGAVKADAMTARAMSASGTLSASHLLAFLTQVVDVRNQLLVDAAVPGISPYAQAQVNDTGLDITAAFNTMTTQLANTRDWIVANFPKNAGGYLLASTFAGDGHQQDRIFAAGETAGLRTVIDDLLATID